jgi:extracellular matrix protein 14
MMRHSLAFLALFAGAVSCEQQVLSMDETQIKMDLTDNASLRGALRRFTGDVQQVLSLAGEHDLDIWHATSTIVDLYSPPDAPFLPEALVRLPHNTTYVPISPPSASSPKLYQYNSQGDFDWNITTLNDTPYHDDYHPLNETHSFLKALAAKHSDVMRLGSIGMSAEGREIIALTVSLSPGDGPGGNYSDVSGRGDGEGADRLKRKKRPAANEGEKLAFVILGAQHAREWVAEATTAYLAHALVANRTEPHSLYDLLTHFDFHIIPVPNPDGYAYTWQTDRYWYKNRQVTSPYTECVGLDMNRNWGYKWSGTEVDGDFMNNTSGISPSADAHENAGIVSKSGKKSKKSKPKDSKKKKSKKSKKDKSKKDKDSNKNTPETPRPPATDPCSHWYPGTRAFESPEVNAIANFVATIPNLVGYVGLRNYGQMLSSPFSYTCSQLPKDAEDQIEAAHGATHEIASVHGIPYAVGSLCSNLYAAPGNILDWMYAREAVKYAYVAHLRDTGTYGFSLPQKWLRPTGEESTGLIDYLARFIAKQAKRKF